MSLGALLTARWGSVEADLQRFYNLDLTVEVHRVSVRRLLALVEGLPADAATWRDDDVWTNRDELLAQIADIVNGWGWAQAELMRAVWAPKLRRFPAPDRLEHPGRPDPRPQGEVVTDTLALAAFINRN